MDLGRLRLTGTGRIPKTYQKWLQSEKILSSREPFQVRKDFESISISEVQTAAELFKRFAEFFEIGLHLERPIPELDSESDLNPSPRILGVFVNGKLALGEMFGFPRIQIRLPEPRLIVQRARATGGVIQLLGLENLRKWSEPHLIYIPVPENQIFIFVSDQPETQGRGAAEQVYRLASQFQKGVN